MKSSGLLALSDGTAAMSLLAKAIGKLAHIKSGEDLTQVASAIGEAEEYAATSLAGIRGVKRSVDALMKSSASKSAVRKVKKKVR